MKYYEVEFCIKCPSEDLMQDARDLLAALAGEAGFETFEETANGLTGYVQQQLFEQDILDAVISDFPMNDIHIIYNVREAEDKDWNEQWEQEGFEPIVVGRIIVHDGRHEIEPGLSGDSRLSRTSSISREDGISIEIDAKMAFGSGTHETTRMMLAALEEQFDVNAPRSVLDCGTGTGILAIAALMLGAEKAVGYDIDEWSADNARHNAVINRVDERFTSLLGDASILDGIHEKFDVVMANINRNILLADMKRMRQHMHDGSTLIISGFYKSDVPLLQEKAHSLGLRLIKERNDGEWTEITLKVEGYPLNA